MPSDTVLAPSAEFDKYCWMTVLLMKPTVILLLKNAIFGIRLESSVMVFFQSRMSDRMSVPAANQVTAADGLWLFGRP